MVQTYGVVPETSVEPSIETDEARALLADPNAPSKRDRHTDGHATLTSGISNLLNTIIGSGMLTFPLAMASAGLIPGVITCALSGSIGAFGLYLLSLCAPRAKHRHASFHAISKLTFPRAAVFFDAAIATKCFGVSISYLIIIKGLMPNVVASLYHDLSSPTTNPPSWALNGNNWIIIFMVILVPVCFLRHLNSLRHTSYIALFSVAYLVVVVIRGYIWPFKNMPAPGEIWLIHFTPDFVSTFPIQVFAFTCAQNLFPIYNEMKSNTQTRMNIVIGGAIGGATVTYEVIAVLGYLTFGSEVGANIIAMYPATSIFIAVGQLAIAILVLFSYPLQVHPCRNCLDKVFHFGESLNAVKPNVHGDEEEEDDDDDDDHSHSEMSKIKHFWLTMAIVVGGFMIAFMVDDLQIVLSFVGATGSTTISFILPGLLFWELTRRDVTVSKTLNWGAFGLMVYGICVFVFCPSLLDPPCLDLHEHPLPSPSPSYLLQKDRPFVLVKMARAQPLSTSQSDSAFSHIYPSSSQEQIGHKSVPLTAASTSPCITSPLSPPSLMETTTSIDSIDAQSTSPFISDLNGGLNFPDADNTTLIEAQAPDVDPQILEALKSKDRIYVLKLGETFEDLIKERRTRAEVSPTTSYQRLLVHRCSAYYKLVPENDPMTKGIFVLYTADSRIPERRISDLVPAESTTQPAFKIMRRSATERRSKPQSQTGSIAGEDADLSDLDPSESGSLGGRSNGGSSKKRMTIEEREAAYNKARSRIFNKFEEQGKDKDMGASTSSFSGSASNSTSTDEPTSSPATVDSEWSAASGPRDKKENRRGNSGNGATPHSRSIRSGASFNGSGSSRNSRAPSPSFTYATLFEPPPSGPMYDTTQHPHSAGYYPNQAMYSFPGQSPMPTPPFSSGYPYYAPYNPYQSPHPHPQYSPSDPPPPSASEPFSPQHQMNYGNYYGWSNQPPMQPPPHTLHHPPPPLQYPNHLNGPPPPQTPPFQTFMPQSQTHPYPYPVNGQFPPLPPPPRPYLSAPPHMNMQQPQQPPYETPRPMNGNSMGHQPDFHPNHNGSGNGLRSGLGNGIISPNSNGRVPVTRGVGPSAVGNGNGVNGTKSRLPMPPQARTAWSYGPGVGMGGYVAPSGITTGDAIGPRLNSNHRRPSGNSNSGNSHASSNCDEVSSTASSSTTSSSSRRTYTSTTSSQHPLPARPDWAVGLKAQPTLAGRVHEQQHSHTNSSSISSPLPWSNGNPPPHHNNSLTSPAPHHQQQPTSLQSTDFPPLTSAQEKRAPVATGAWGVSRPSLSPTNVNGNMNGVNGSGTAHNSPTSRLDEAEGGGAERPVGKTGELYNPKSVRQVPVNANGGGQNGHQRVPSDKVKDVMSIKNGEVAANASLVVAVSTMSLGENGVEPSPSISTFQVGIEQEPTVATTSST